MNGRYTMADASRPASVLNILAGIWLAICPWILGFVDSTAIWNTCILGIVVIILAAIRLNTVGTQPLSWLNCLCGVWLIISPFVLHYSGYVSPMWNDIILGILVVLFGLWGALGTTNLTPTTTTTTTSGTTPGGSTGTTSVSGTPPASQPSATKATSSVVVALGNGRVMLAHIVRRNGAIYLMLKVASKAKEVRIRFTELASDGHVLKRMTVVVQTGRKQLVKIPYTSAVTRVKVAVVS
jgi:hypothetical protein